MQLVVAIGTIRALPVVHAHAEHAVIARALQARLLQIGETLLDLLRRPVKEQAEVTLVAHGRVERVGAIQRDAVLARLQVFPAERNLRLACAQAPLLAGIEPEIGVRVAQLREVRRSRARRRAGEIGLQVDRHPVADVATDHHARATHAEALLAPDEAIARRT